MSLQAGLVDVGFLGALEIDRFGNLNTTLLKDESGNIRYFNGSAGGNDTASLSKRVVVIMRHNKRKLRQTIAHLTSPGFVGGQDRQKLSLRGGGPHRLITDSVVIGFDTQTHTATLVSVHPVVRLEDVLRETGFPLNIPKDLPPTPMPSSEEIRLLREEIDPQSMYL
jgi:glutaconate CoA-transferase, subunit B